MTLQCCTGSFRKDPVVALNLTNFGVIEHVTVGSLMSVSDIHWQFEQLMSEITAAVERTSYGKFQKFVFSSFASDVGCTGITY